MWASRAAVALGLLAVLAGCSGAGIARVAAVQTAKAVVSAETEANAEEAAATMRAGVEICVEESRDMSAAIPRFREAGWQMDALGPQEFEISKGGVGGFLDAERSGCRFESDRVSFDAAKALTDDLIARRFAKIAQRGRLEGPTETCDGWVLFPGQGIVTIRYDGLGQDPVCPDPKGASILVSGSGA